MSDSQFNIFSTPIWGVVINDQSYQAIDYVGVIKDISNDIPTEIKSNFGGYQTHDNLHRHPVFREFTGIIENIATTCYNEYSGKQLKAKITDMWGNINHPGSYNGAHTHGGQISGVFYLKTPPNSGRLILCNPAVRSDSSLIRSSNYPIVPQPLACILFPSWLEHYVEPNRSNEDRISISFNLVLE